MIAAQSGNRDPLDDAYRAATPVFDVPVLRAIGAFSPDGLYPQGRYPASSCSTATAASAASRALRTVRRIPVALEDWAHWHYALVSLGITPPWTREEFEDFDEWLAVMIEEAELGYSDDAMYLLPEATPAIDYELPSPEPSC